MPIAVDSQNSGKLPPPPCICPHTKWREEEGEEKGGEGSKLKRKESEGGASGEWGWGRGGVLTRRFIN